MSGSGVVLSSSVQGGQAVILFSGANGIINVAANTTGGASDIGNPATNDPIIGGTISSIWWSASGTNSISVARGSNTLLNLNYTGQLLRADSWGGINLYSAANITVVCPANSYVFIVVSKEYPFGSPGVTA